MIRDPMVQPATPRQIAAFAAQRKISEDVARQELEKLRERQIAARKSDPYTYGYEPPIWYVVKALMRNPVWSEYERAHIRKRLGADWTAERFAETMRSRLGFQYPVTKVLVMGSNRSGKTDFSAKLCVQTLRAGNKFVTSGAQTLKTQKQNQMRRVWNYMPLDWKAKNIATKKANDVVENISYSEKNGFAGSKATFKNGSILSFMSYEQTIASQEGTEFDLVHLDEEYGIDHYNLMTTRITSRGGVFLGTFTPLHGYTPQIQKFLADSQIVRYHWGFLRPKDGGEKMPWRELNLTKEEYEELNSWRREGQQGDCFVPESRPEDSFEWLFDEGDGRDPLQVPEGRTFDAMPRVAICQGGQAAAVWFYGSDNPYGLPSELIITKMADENAEKRILESVYGVAHDMKGQLLKTFRRERNVIRDAELPKRLVRCMVVDPAPERNWCMLWAGFDPESGILYVYREWPGNYEIPGEGVPGPWVVSSDKNGGMNDGARGDGQNSFGFGYDHIKFEIARLEGWKSFHDWQAVGYSLAAMPEDIGVVDDWRDEDGADEQMVFRILDSRAASQSKISGRSNNTLLADLEERMSGWIVADGQKCEIGYSVLIDKFAAGKIKICESCVNTIDCIEMLTGRDGQKGAAKDFCDLLRYLALSDIWNFSADAATERGDNHPVGSGHLRAGMSAATFGRRRSRVWW